MSKIVIIEGPNCVGKTTLADYIVENTEMSLYYNEMYQDTWETPRDAFVEHSVVYAMGRYPDINLVLDRGFLSFMYYNSEYRSIDYLSNWIDVLDKWDSVKVICLNSSYRQLLINSEKKGDKDGVAREEVGWYSGMYKLIPEHLRIEVDIVYYESHWKEDILKEIMNG